MFKVLKPITGSDVKKATILNSANLEVGEVIVPSTAGNSAFVTTGGGTTAGLLGIVLSIVGDCGKVLEVNQRAVAADNQTVGKIQVEYFPLFIPSEIEAVLDANAGTTTGSAGHGNFAVDATGLLLAENSYVAYTTNSAKQFFSFGLVDGTARTVTTRYTRGALI
jgi:hypothetical protein